MFEKQEQIYEDYGIFDDDDFDRLSDSRQDAFEDALEELDVQYEQLEEEFGFVEPELSEEQETEFEEKLSVLDSKFMDLHDEFDISFEDYEDCSDCDEYEFKDSKSEQSEIISQLEQELLAKNDRIIELEQEVEDLEKQVQNLQEIISEQLSVIFDWVTGK